MQQSETIPQNYPPGQPAAPSPDERLKQSKRRRRIYSWLSTAGILLAAPLLAVILTLFVFQSYQVDGPSMEKTLQNKDRLIVLKLGKTWSRITGNDFIPKRNEVIVFKQVGGSSPFDTEEKQLIKRVVGLPGDRVVIQNNILTIYNDESPGGFNPDTQGDYIIDPFITPGNIDVTIKKGEVYVCGDNRANSQDSRYFGPVPSDNIVGTLSLRIYPFNKIDSF